MERLTAIRYLLSEDDGVGILHMMFVSITLFERMYELLLPPSWISMHSVGASFSTEDFERASMDVARWVDPFVMTQTST